MKKVLFVIFSCIMLSGCSVDYDLFYKSKDEVIETIKVGIQTNEILNYNDNVEDYFYDTFVGWKSSYGLKKYDYEVEEGETTSYINVKKTHENLFSVFDSEVIKQYFENVNIYNLGENIVLELTNYIVDDGESYIESGSDIPLNITIKSNYKVITNADVANDGEGVYKWTFNSSSKDKSIKVTFTDELNMSAYFNNTAPIVPVIILVIIVGLIGFVIVKVIMKRNKQMNEI